MEVVLKVVSCSRLLGRLSSRWGRMRLHAYMLIRAGTEPTRKQAVILLMDVKLNQIMPMGSVPARINM